MREQGEFSPDQDTIVIDEVMRDFDGSEDPPTVFGRIFPSLKRMRETSRYILLKKVTNRCISIKKSHAIARVLSRSVPDCIDLDQDQLEKSGARMGEVIQDVLAISQEEAAFLDEDKKRQLPFKRLRNLAKLLVVMRNLPQDEQVQAYQYFYSLGTSLVRLSNYNIDWRQVPIRETLSSLYAMPDLDIGAYLRLFKR